MRDLNPTHRPVRPTPGVAPWVGGKRNLAGRIIERIEAIPHTCYAEPFIGMGGVFLRRPRRAPAEVINDRAGEVSNLFRCLQRHPAALVSELRYGVAARTTFERLRRTDPATLTDIERAARFFFLQLCVYGGLPRGVYSASAVRPARLDTGRLIPLLRAVSRRLAGVTIEALDFEALIRRYDRPTTLFYLDPPYWGAETYYGRGLFQRSDFERLAGVLRGIKGRFLLSLNDRPEVRALFGAFHLERVTTTYRVGGVQPTAELLISGPGRDR